MDNQTNEQGFYGHWKLLYLSSTWSEFELKAFKAFKEIQQLPFRLLIFCALWEGWLWIRNSLGTFWTQTFLHCARPPDQQNWNQNFSKLISLLINKLFTTNFNISRVKTFLVKEPIALWKEPLDCLPFSADTRVKFCQRGGEGFVYYSHTNWFGIFRCNSETAIVKLLHQTIPN